MRKLSQTGKVVFAGCTATALWTGFLAITDAVEGKWATALLFLVLCLVNANSVAAIYRRLT